MSLTLTIDFPGGPLVYDAVTLLRQTPSFASEYTQGKVGQPNAQMRIPEMFLGVSDWMDLPEGEWRATVTLDGVTLLNGRCRRKDVEWDGVSRDFVVQVVDDSADAAKSALQGVRLTDLPPAQYAALQFREITALIPTLYKTNVGTGGEDFKYLKKLIFVRAYKLISVMQQTFAAAGLDGAPTEMYDLVAPYLNTTGGNHLAYFRRPVHPAAHIFSLQGYSGEFTEDSVYFYAQGADYTRNSLTLPNWDAWKVTEQFCKLCGLTFAARYEAFPSEQITVELLPDTWQETAGLPEVDGLFNKAKETLRREDAWKNGLAITYGRVTKLPELVTWGSGMYNVTADQPLIDQVWTPPEYAVRAADRWLFDADGKPLDAEEISVDFTLASLGVPGDQDFDVQTVTEPDGSGLGESAVQEMLLGYPVFEKVDDERCYIANVVGLTETDRAVLGWRRLVNGTFEMAFVNEVWPREAFRNYGLSRVERDIVEGTVNAGGSSTLALGDLVPGRLDQGISFRGQPWLIEKVERRTEDRAISIRGSRPALIPAPESDLPFYTGAVQALAGKFTDIENGVNPEKEYIRVTWDWPTAQSGRASMFDAQRWVFETNAWVYMAQRTFSRHVWDFGPHSFGPDEEGERHARYRVRAVMDEQSGIADTLGPWTELRVYW